ncbi:hypothetical protein ABW20_dc0105459 [Dactylellina cionopaga]|nr:hypothetical protein ABW20_dc0105459 [Dactylellina cionopaga]
MKLAGVQRYGYLDEVTKVVEEEGGEKKTVCGWLQPAYERFSYEMLCLHCYKPINVPSKSLWGLDFPSFCDCRNGNSEQLQPNKATGGQSSSSAAGDSNSPSSSSKKPGCRLCGTATVKYTLVEVFDLVREKTGKGRYSLRQDYYRLFLATECIILPDYSPLAVEKERIQPFNTAKSVQALNIVRGSSPDSEIRPFPSPSPRKTGITDIPYPVLRDILKILLDDPEGLHAYYQSLQASYCFLKAYYRGNVGRATLEKLQERYTYSRGVSWPAPFPADPRQVG